MRRRSTLTSCFVAVLVLAATACDRGEAPELSTSPSAAVSQTAAATTGHCADDPDFTVDSRQELGSAIVNASAGDVIAVEGKVTSSRIIPVNQTDVTLTCASAGAEIELADNPNAAEIPNLLLVTAPNVTIRGLLLDTRPTSTTHAHVTLLAHDNGLGSRDADGFAFNHNTVQCNARGLGACVRIHGVENTTVRGNEVHATGELDTGFKIASDYEGSPDGSVPEAIDGSPPRPVDGATVVNNTVTTDVPSVVGHLGAISVRGGANVTVRGNRVRGPWQNGIRLANVQSSVASGNDVQGALRYGLWVSRRPGPDARSRHLEIATNSVADGGYRAAIRVNRSSVVSIRDNSVEAGAGPYTIFTLRTDSVDVTDNQVAGSASRSITVGTLSPDSLTAVTIARNDVMCEDGGCIFAYNLVGSLIAENTVRGTSLSSGIHIQTKTDGARVVDNTVVTEKTADIPIFGAIRVRDGSGLTVRGNEVRGPWPDGLAVTNLESSTFRRNSFEGIDGFAVKIAENPLFAERDVGGSDNLFRHNQIVSAGGGFLLDEACDNGFAGNRLPAGRSVPSIVLTEETGDNTFVGKGNTGVDHGRFDCDGDGRIDPNQVTGLTPPKGGLDVGDILPGGQGPTSSGGGMVTIK